MIPEIIPIVSPKIDWLNYLAVSKRVLGYSLSKEIDNQKLSLCDSSFLLSLQTFETKIYETSIPWHLLRHLTYSFLIVLDYDDYIKLIENSPTINIISSQTIEKNVKLLIASGNLEDWKFECIQERSTRELQILFDKIVLYFESNGLGKMFIEYKKTTLKNNTFILEEK
jgi:hypothetical protein